VDDEDVERRIELAGDLEHDRDASARQSESDQILTGVRAEALGEHPARAITIAKAH